MPQIDKRAKKYIKKHCKTTSIGSMAKTLALPPSVVEDYIQKRWGQTKALKVTGKSVDGWQERAKAFRIGTFFSQHQNSIYFLVFVVFLVYVNSFTGEFVSDDVAGILKNPVVGSLKVAVSNPPAILRPLIITILHTVFGNIPFPYRLLNVILHSGSVLCLYTTLVLLTNKRVATIASLLVAVHPLLTESVTWISGGIYAQYAFFCMLSLVFFVVSFGQKSYFKWAVVAFLLALGSSEKAMAWPFILGAFTLSQKDWKPHVKRLIPFILLGVVWVGIYFTRVQNRLSDLQTTHYQKSAGPVSITKIVPIAIGSYLELTAWPKKLTLYHSEMNFTRQEYMGKIGLLCGYLVITVIAFVKRKQVFFWLAFFGLSLAPVLTPFGISWVVAERYVYLGVFGLISALVIFTESVATKLKVYNGWVGLMVVVILLLGGRTVQRNRDWHNEDALWVAAAKYSPTSAQNHNNLGDMYARHKLYDKAIEEFGLAIQLLPGYADAYHNQANVYFLKGDVDSAIKQYQAAIEFNPVLWPSYMNLANVYFQVGELTRGQEVLELAISKGYVSSEVFANLGYLYLREGNKQQAQAAITKALELDPKNAKARQTQLDIDSTP